MFIASTLPTISALVLSPDAALLHLTGAHSGGAVTGAAWFSVACSPLFFCSMLITDFGRLDPY